MSVYEVTLLLNGGEQAEQTELDLIANLAKEVAELKRELAREQEYRSSIYVKVSDLRNDANDLEVRIDENEKDTEELIGRINDLGDGSEVAAVVLTKAFEYLLEELEAYEKLANDGVEIFRKGGVLYEEKFESGRSHGVGYAITRIKEALRNG